MDMEHKDLASEALALEGFVFVPFCGRDPFRVEHSLSILKSKIDYLILKIVANRSYYSQTL